MKLKRLTALVSAILVVAMGSSTLAYADVAGETEVKYLTPELLFELESEAFAEESENQSQPEENAETDVEEVVEESVEEVTDEAVVTEEDVAVIEETEVVEEPEIVVVPEETEAIEEVAIITPVITPIITPEVISEEVTPVALQAEVEAEVVPSSSEVAVATTDITVDTYKTTISSVDPSITGVAGFIARIYTLVLNRQYDQSGLDFWCGELDNYKSDGYTIFNRITNCPEFKDRVLTDEEFLTIMYMTFFNRDPDEGGFNFWLDRLQNEESFTRDTLISGFVNSEEWANVCAKYGILSGGNHKATLTDVEVTDGCVNFVKRLYLTCFGREADEAGLKHWCQEISNLNYTGKYTAKYFVFSQEFNEKLVTLSDEELVTIFYHVFFGREPDFDGMCFWLDQIQFGSKVEILFNGFSDSAEFKDICESNGIFPGPSLKVPVQESISDPGFRKFLQAYTSYGMNVLSSAELNPKLTYRYADIQSSERKDYEYNIPQKDIEAIQKFEASHMDPSWTPAMKAAYMFYWIHENMLYARGGPVAPTYCVAALERKYGQCAQYNGAMVEYLCYLGYDACLVKGWRGRTGPTGAQHYWGELYVNGETYVIEVGNADSDGSWNYFFVPYSFTRKYIVCGVVQG